MNGFGALSLPLPMPGIGIGTIDALAGC